MFNYKLHICLHFRFYIRKTKINLDNLSYSTIEDFEDSHLVGSYKIRSSTHHEDEDAEIMILYLSLLGLSLFHSYRLGTGRYPGSPSKK